MLLRMIRRLGWECQRRADAATLQKGLRAAGVQHAPSIPTYTRPSELRVLYDLARSLPSSSAALEIGSYFGAATCYLAAGLKQIGGELYCVDTWQNQTMPEGPKDTFAAFEQNVRPIRPILHVIRKVANKVTREDVPRDIELIFIDGDHGYDAVWADFERFSPWVSPSGIVVFHDGYNWRDVSRCIGQIVAGGQWAIEGRKDDLVWLSRARFQH